MSVEPDAVIEAQDIIKSVPWYAADAGSNDTYAISLPEAPSAYADGLTVRFKANTANTGPCTLNVNTLGAIAIKKFGGRDLQTGDIYAGDIVQVVYLGGVFYMIGGRELPSFQQILASHHENAFLSPTSASQPTFGSNQDGSVIYYWHRENGASNYYLTRFERDSVTGQYFPTHKQATTITAPSNDNNSIIEIGSYIYLFTNDNANIICRRFLASDLSGETTMTVPTVACTGDVLAWTDGTFAYLTCSASNTTSRKWSLSGTTFSAVTTDTITNPFSLMQSMSSFFDGTTAYWLKFVAHSNGGSLVITKLNTIMATSVSETTKKSPMYSDAQGGAVIAGIDSKRIYVGTTYSVYDETAIIQLYINLMPVAKP